MDIDTNRLDDAVLALLWYNLTATGSAWKGFDWETMDRLSGRALISDPARKTKSVSLTTEGLIAGERLFKELFSGGA